MCHFASVGKVLIDCISGEHHHWENTIIQNIEACAGPSMWATLASMAMAHKELNTAKTFFLSG